MCNSLVREIDAQSIEQSPLPKSQACVEHILGCKLDSISVAFIFGCKLVLQRNPKLAISPQAQAGCGQRFNEKLTLGCNYGLH